MGRSASRTHFWNPHAVTRASFHTLYKTFNSWWNALEEFITVHGLSNRGAEILIGIVDQCRKLQRSIIASENVTANRTPVCKCGLLEEGIGNNLHDFFLSTKQNMWMKVQMDALLSLFFVWLFRQVTLSHLFVYLFVTRAGHELHLHEQ